MVQPINYYDALIPDFAGISLKETQNRAMQNQVSAMRNENSMMRQQAEANRAFQQDWQNAWNSGDDNQIVNLLGKHPGKVQQINDALGIRDGQQQKAVNNMVNDLSVALQVGTPAAIGQAISKHPETIKMIGSSPEEAIQFMLSNPNGARDLLKTIQLSTMTADKQFDVMDKQEGRAETARSNKAREAENARNNNMVNARGWAGVNIQKDRLNFDKQKESDRKAGVGSDSRSVQLNDGRTVRVSGKLHGAGANAFYEGVDDSGNTVRVPANAIAAPATSASNATNYAMKKDIDSILNAGTSDLGFMTGYTGGAGSPAIGADYGSRFSGKEERQLYMAAQRIQGRMQNQGIAAAKDMGASGINTIPEAKMYFQGMPQIDYSSPESMQQSVREIQQYTDNYNSQYNVNVGGSYQQSTPNSQGNTTQQSGNYSSLWGD